MAPLWPFRRAQVEREPLAVTMIGVRMGERLLQIVEAQSDLVTAVAAKPGISGTSAIVVTTAAERERIGNAVAESGALVDLHVGDAATLPFADASFDVVVVHPPSRMSTGSDELTGSRGIRECRRVVRVGGRILVLERGTPTGVRGLLGSPSKAAAGSDSSGAVKLLQAAGLTAVRVLADREGLRFIEGLNA